MFSKVLIKLIDQAIIPALVLLVTRIISMVLVSNLYGISYVLDRGGFLFETDKDFVFVNTYSLLAMVVIVALGLGYVLFKSIVLHETHITPSLTSKLFSLRLSSLIQTSFDVYSQGVVWLSYMYLLTLVVFLMAIFSFVHAWLFVFSAILSILATIGLIFDIEQEMTSSDEDDELLDSDEYVVSFKDN